nr:TFIIB related factor hBRF [Cryptomonas paramecium]
MKCKKCNKNDINYQFADSKTFCRSCGTMIEKCHLVSENYSDSLNLKSSKIKNFFQKKNGSNLSENSTLFDIVPLSAKRKIVQIVNLLKLDSTFQEYAYRLFLFVFQKGIIRKYKLLTTCICCVYVVCRYKKAPYLLVDFSEIVQTQLNKLGAVFLKIIRDLNIFLPIIDPSLFVHKFATNLQFGNKTNVITKTALRLVSKMKRDWISTGRKPSGLCGAALLISSCIHGLKRSKKEIEEVVKIGDFTLGSRLREIDKTLLSNLNYTQINLKNFKRVNFLPNDSRFHSHGFFVDAISHFYTKKKIKNDGYKVKHNLLYNFHSNKTEKNFNEQNIIRQINTNLESCIKENIWCKNSLIFIYSQCSTVRIQKEKPFAFFKINNAKYKLY